MLARKTHRLVEQLSQLLAKASDRPRQEWKEGRRLRSRKGREEKTVEGEWQVRKEVEEQETGGKKGRKGRKEGAQRNKKKEEKRSRRHKER